MLNDLWEAGSPPWRVWDGRAGGTGHRPVRIERALVTGGRGFVGAWLCRALVERGVEVSSFDRRGPRERPSTLAMLGLDGTVEEREGELLDDAVLAGVLPEGGIDTVFHLAAETIVGTVQADPVGGFETNVRGTWTAARGLPARRGRAGRRRLLRQGLRRPRRASLPRGLRAAADGALRGLEGGRRPDRPLLLAVVRAAGRRDPLRQRLRRRRPQLLAARPRGGLRGARRPRAGAALRRLAAFATCSTSRTRRPPTWRSPMPSTATTSAARRSTPAGERPYSVLEIVAAIDPAVGHRGRAGDPRRRQPRAARSTASSSTRRSCASAAAGAVGLARGGTRADDRLVPGAPRGAPGAERESCEPASRPRPEEPRVAAGDRLGGELGERRPAQPLPVPARGRTDSIAAATFSGVGSTIGSPTSIPRRSRISRRVGPKPTTGVPSGERLDDHQGERLAVAGQAEELGRAHHVDDVPDVTLAAAERGETRRGPRSRARRRAPRSAPSRGPVPASSAASPASAPRPGPGPPGSCAG